MLGQRIDDFRSEMKAGFEGVNARLDRLETRFDRIEDEVRKDHGSRLSRLEARVFSRTA
jgi:tetrahydromethanopterin S-methyltransferase subunit G